MKLKFKFLIVLSLAFACMSVMVGCRFNKPTFEDFAEYNDDFIVIRDFILDCSFARNDASSYVVDLNDDIISISDVKVENESAILESVNKLNKKGFTYVKVEADYMIFWEDETGYYGVLWSLNPKQSIDNIVKSSRSNMKSRKLAKEWYEVGALDAI